MSLTGKTKVFGVLANPVEHSLSPQLHGALAEFCGLDMAYVPLKTPVEHVGEAMRGAYCMNIQGMNATLPHKVALIPWLVGIDPIAADIGAVNTLKRVQNGYEGYNTDVPGLARAMKEAGMSPEGREILLLGAGGAARAAVYMALSSGAKSVTILNRSLHRAEELAAFAKEKFPDGNVKALSNEEWRKLSGTGYLAIQTTSVGMWPNVDAAPIEEEDFYELIADAYDAIYTPEETKFLRLVREHGGKGEAGLSMLLYQGVRSFEIWNDMMVPDDVISRTMSVLRDELRKKA